VTAVASGPTRVLICEDSRTYAAALGRALEHDGDIVVAGVCATAEDVLDRLAEVRPDLVTMDIHLPGMNGIQAVEQIMSSRPVPILVLSSLLGSGSELAAAALAAGAIDAVAKDDLDLTRPGGPASGALRHRVKVLSRAHVIRHPRARLRGGARRARTSGQAAAIGICASTGGPQALSILLRALPASFAVPVLVVQHISAGFTEGLARWLDTSVPLPVRLGEAGRPLTSGVWIAPEANHLKVAPDGTLTLDRTTVAGLHRPSGDVLLQSLVDVYGPEAVAVVLSGMGRDGAAGARAVHLAGGLVLAQDEASSAVFGMPKAAAEDAGAVLLAPEQIAWRLAALTVAPPKERAAGA
jgi:two-component system chemotaxis response regulator CheB